MNNKIFAPCSKAQQDFLAEEGSDVCFYGSGAAAGKTTMLMYKLIPYVYKQNISVLFLCNFPKWTMYTALDMFKDFNVSKHLHRTSIRFPCGAEVLFARSKPKGGAFDIIIVDEVQNFSKQEYDDMNRYCDRMFVSFNSPSNKPHHWLHSYFGSLISDSGWMDKEKGKVGVTLEGRLVKVIVATVEDNPVMKKNYPEYMMRLKSLSPEAKAGLLYGWWGNFHTHPEAEEFFSNV